MTAAQKHMKPAAYRIFRNNRWTYSDAPSIRIVDRAAWQPLYSDMQLKELEERIRAEERGPTDAPHSS